MENMEKQPNQRKTDKTEDNDCKRHKNKAARDHKAVIDGKEQSEGSGTMTFSYKKLQVPKELIKKTKKLVETTTGLNNTFIQFIQQTAEDQGEKSIRFRHLKAFKAVLSDLKKAHSALEAALEPEFNMELQNGNEEQHMVRNSSEAVDPAEDDHTDDTVCEADTAKNMDVDEHNEQDTEKSSLSEMKDHQTATDGINKSLKTEVCDDGLVSADEMSLDCDIMSVPPSVPEELFQMVESLSDSTMLSQPDKNSVRDTDTKPNGNSADTLNPQPKVKNLIVKLTPVPVVTTCGSRSSRSKNKEEAEGMTKICKEEHEMEKSVVGDKVDGTGSSPPTRRSSRVKTTPLRKQTENEDQKDSSESESEEDGKGKTKSSKRTRSTKKHDGKQTKDSEKKTDDSDSDEVPQILLEKAAEGHSTDDEQETTKAKKTLCKQNASRQDAEKQSKRKRKSESSDSDPENKSKKTPKKKKQKDSGSSDSDQEEIKSKTKRKSSRAKKQNDTKGEDGPSTEGKAADRRRSYEKKCKRKGSKSASKLQSSSSEDEEEQAESGEDSDAQKIKPIVEDNVMGGSGVFHQSSGSLL